MAWPDALVLLLERSDSRASQALRWGLHGLRASWQAVLEEVPQDPGCGDLRMLLAELEALLGPGHLSTSPVLPPDTAGDGAPAGPAVADAHLPRLLSLARAVAGDRRFQAELKQSPISDASDDDIWNGVQRLLLRVPLHLADEWRQRSQELADGAGGRLDEWAAVALPLPWDEAIYPGVTGEVRAAGLRSAPTAPLDPRVAAPADESLQVLARVTSTCLWFVDHDPHLSHCLKSVFRFGVAPRTGEQRERYVAELLRLWERVRTASSLALRVGVSGAGEEAAREHADTPRQRLKEQMKALLDLDEALHSLVYQPPAAAESWWARLLGQAREALFRSRDRAVQAGCAVHLQALGGTFADINRLAPDSLQVDFGVPGEVSACLRVWARIDGEELKGRVLYRSPQEEA
jgi:hypothetical protein